MLGKDASLERSQYVLLVHALVLRHQPQNAVEGTDADRIVVGYRDTLMRRRIGLQDDVAAFLMNLAVVPMLAEGLGDLAPREVTRDFHAASTSSRTKCRRIERASFSGWSK